MLTTATELQEKGFTLVKGLVPDTASLYNFINKLVEMGRGTFDQQVPGSRGFYKNVLFEKLLETLLPDIEQNSGYELYKTYSYARQYHLGEELKVHRDRPACEVTVSLCLGNEGEAWPIWIRDREKKKHSFTCQPGDAVIFKGVELTHWRDINTFGGCSQVFLHYVDQHGPYADKKDDAGNAKHGY